MYWRFPPRSGSFLRRWYLFSSLFGAGYTTCGIRAWDSRVSLLQTGHHGIFAITFFLRSFRSWNFYGAKLKSWGILSKNFRACFTIFSEIWSMEFRSFFRLLNRSSWNLRYNFVSTKVQNMKFLGREAEILRKLITKFQSLVCNIFRDMIYGR